VRYTSAGVAGHTHQGPCPECGGMIA
jgi:hypothetical protein